jgi:hypothetical protein
MLFMLGSLKVLLNTEKVLLCAEIQRAVDMGVIC